MAQNRTAKSHDQGSKFDSEEPSGMIIGEVSTEQTTENTQNLNAVSNSSAVWWRWYVSDGKFGGYLIGDLRHLSSTFHAWRRCPKMSEQDKFSWDCGKGFGNQLGKGWQFSGDRLYGKGFGKKGLNEMGGNGWDVDDVWDLNEIHLLTAGPLWLRWTVRWNVTWALNRTSQ